MADFRITAQKCVGVLDHNSNHWNLMYCANILKALDWIWRQNGPRAVLELGRDMLGST